MAESYDVMTSGKAKALLEKKGIKMPWEKGYEEQLQARTPDAEKQVAEITAREDANLEDAQVKKIKKAMKGKEEEGVAE